MKKTLTKRRTPIVKSTKLSKFKHPRHQNKSGSNVFSFNHQKDQDEEISSEDESVNLPDLKKIDTTTEFEKDEESAEDKRRRLAKQYLSVLQESNEDNEIDDGDDNSSEIGNTMKKERLLKKGAYFRNIADDIVAESSRFMSGHNGSVTCLTLSEDNMRLFSGSKDNSIYLWDLESGKKLEIKSKWNKKLDDIPSHRGEILTLAINSEHGNTLISGGKDGILRVFDYRVKSAEVSEMKGHRGQINSIAIQKNSFGLFSGSSDRYIKHWDVRANSYVETLFGHQDEVLAVDCWNTSRPVSSSSDRTIRSWKVADETHLVFRGHKGSIDNVQIINQESFISAGQDGDLCLWKTSNKTPIVTKPTIHGFDVNSQTPRWISSLASCKISDLAASGSNDGFVRLWQVVPDVKRVELIQEIKVDGFVNAICLSSELMAIGVGPEHKYGRWWNQKGVKPGILLCNMKQKKND